MTTPAIVYVGAIAALVGGATIVAVLVMCSRSRRAGLIVLVMTSSLALLVGWREGWGAAWLVFVMVNGLVLRWWWNIGLGGKSGPQPPRRERWPAGSHPDNSSPSEDRG